MSDSEHRLPTIKVAVPAPVPYALTYRLLPEMAHIVRPGVLVEVPFGSQIVSGVVWNERTLVESEEPTEEQLRPIRQIIDPEPVIPEPLMRLLGWICRYYAASPGDVIRVALPPGVLRKTDKRIFAGARLDEPELIRDESVERLIDAVRKNGSIPLSKAFSMGIGKGVLDMLESSGKIEIKTVLGAAKTNPKRERWAVAKDLELLESIAGSKTKKQRIAAMLLESNALPTSFINQQEPNASAQIRALAKAGAIRIELRRKFRTPISGNFSARADRPDEASLSPEQAKAIQVVSNSIDAGRFGVFLLHGVTGSGKTEVYIRAAAHARNQGKKSLILVPEVALTPQLIWRFSSEFGDRIAVWHSYLSDGERLDEWSRIRAGEVDIVIGARSAIFAPLDNLGLVVVDEEHEPSYKSEDRVYYSARDAAVVRAKLENATVVLGSATPSLESLHNARLGKYQLLSLPKRITGKELPEIKVVRLAPRDLQDDMLLSSELIVETNNAIERNEQAIFFMPRRGFAHLLQCTSCGWVHTCPNCDVSLTYHKQHGKFVCHYCDYHAGAPKECPECGSPELELVGPGTEKAMELLEAYFPGSKILRLDRDAVTRRGEMERILSEFSSGGADILVGTQMITKGHHFPRVSVVGVLVADLTLNFPDFRAAERTFQLLMQVAGRSGRGSRRGSVIIQTLNPEHKIFDMLKAHDFDEFARFELSRRKSAKYPPFVRIVRILLRSEDADAAISAAKDVKQMLVDLIKSSESLRTVSLLGPAYAPLSRIKNQHRVHIVLKIPQVSQLSQIVSALAHLQQEIHSKPKVRMKIDVDPQNMI